MRLRRQARGLTLIELMIAIAILAVLVSLAVPSFSTYLQRQRLKTTAQILSVDLAEARFEAARRGQTLHLVYQAGAEWCYAIATTPGCDCHVAQACRLKGARAADARGVLLTEATNATFDPTGATVGPPSSAMLQTAGSGDRLRVDLSPLGRARICGPDGALGQVPGC